jgi:t-SNARE complex subunit (syntaxin)
MERRRLGATLGGELKRRLEWERKQRIKHIAGEVVAGVCFVVIVVAILVLI